MLRAWGCRSQPVAVLGGCWPTGIKHAARLEASCSCASSMPADRQEISSMHHRIPRSQVHCYKTHPRSCMHLPLGDGVVRPRVYLSGQQGEIAIGAWLEAQEDCSRMRGSRAASRQPGH